MLKSSLLFFLLTFSLTFSLWAQTAGELPARFSIEKMKEMKNVLKYKGQLIKLNKLIPIGEEEEGKTWNIYTKSILKRKNLYFVFDHEAEGSAAKKSLIGIGVIKDDDHYLSWLAIHPDYRGSKNGRLAEKLLYRILQDFPQIHLDVRQNNTIALQFYRKLSCLMEVVERPGETYKNGDQGLHFVLGPLLE